MGGLIALVVALSAAEPRTIAETAPFNALAPRFSSIGFWCMAVLALTGAYNTWLHLPTLKSFATTDYGRVLAGKLMLLAPILALALVSRRRALPALASAAVQVPEVAYRWARRLRTLVLAEAVLAVPLLLLAGLLTTLPPATTAASVGPLELTTKTDRGHVTLRLSSNRVGASRAAVVIQDPAGTKHRKHQVTLFVRCLEMDMGVAAFEASEDADGSYNGLIMFPMVGRTRVSVEIAPPQQDRYVAEFELDALP
jgi:hypothetical protein